MRQLLVSNCLILSYNDIIIGSIILREQWIVDSGQWTVDSEG